MASISFETSFVTCQQMPARVEFRLGFYDTGASAKSTLFLNSASAKSILSKLISFRFSRYWCQNALFALLVFEKTGKRFEKEDFHIPVGAEMLGALYCCARALF